MINHSTCTLSRLPKHFALNHSVGRAVFILSAPGIGKTQSVLAYAESIRATCYVLVASLRDRVDFGGLPFRVVRAVGSKQMELTEFVPLRLFAELSKEHNPEGGPVVLYFNELNACNESVLATLFRIFAERAIEDMNLRDNVQLIADGNPASALSVGRDIPLAMQRRFSWLVLEHSLEEWIAWAIRTGIDGRILAFFNIGAFVQHFSDFDPKKRERITYATPAGWEIVSRKLPLLLDARSGYDAKDIELTLTGDVGHAAGIAVAAFLAHAASIPNIDHILEDPAKALLPQANEMRGLMCGCVVNHVLRNRASIRPALELVIRLVHEKENATPEWGVFLLRTLYRTNKFTPVILKSEAFRQCRTLLPENEFLEEALRAAAA